MRVLPKEDMNNQSNNPLHGKTLENILQALVTHLGWQEMARLIDIKCFKQDPSIKSSLTFLRKTPWARQKVEELFLTLPAAGTGKIPGS